MSTIIDKLKDKFGNFVLPVTNTKAVYDDDGNRLDNTLNDIKSSVVKWDGANAQNVDILARKGNNIGVLRVDSNGEISQNISNDNGANWTWRFMATRNTISDIYDASRTYAQGEFCIYNNILWKSKVDNNTGNTPTNGTYWTATNVGSELSEKYSIEHITGNTDGAGLIWIGPINNNKIPILCIPKISDVGFWYSAQIFTVYDGNGYNCACRFIDVNGTPCVSKTVEYDLYYLNN